ncbi:MAG TPA: response regulator [Ktedonobacteraceae bacterium]|nr:response regulator [Ktedonobacteraceae bacterium]
MVIDRQNVEENEKLIAIVEDDAHLATMFQDILQHAGYWRLHIFADGQSAKDQIPELAPHLILLDVGLPNLDGASLFKILRGHSSTKNTPIIVITASHDWELQRMGLQTGLLLRKPFQMQELLFMVRALLREP